MDVAFYKLDSLGKQYDFILFKGYFYMGHYHTYYHENHDFDENTELPDGFSCWCMMRLIFLL